MALRISAALRSFVAAGGSYKQAFDNGRLEIYVGTQPASPDVAASGALLATITAASASHVAETSASGGVAFAGSSGSINGLTVGGTEIMDAAVAYTTSLANTMTLLAAAINKSSKNLDFDCVASADAIVLTPRPNRGTRFNSAVVNCSCTTLVPTDDDFDTGGAYATGGLLFEDAAAGVLAKRVGQVWSGVAGAGGTAGWFRLYGPKADTGIVDSAEAHNRLDGSIATSGAQLNIASTTIVNGATQTVASFSPTQPAA